MSKHLFGLIATPYGVAANNRGENEGNITTLQKLLWKGEVHSTVSAEAIRWAVRYFWQRKGIPVNRVWDEMKNDHVWEDKLWLPWTAPEGDGKDKETYIDDDMLGFMLAEAAGADGSDALDGLKKEKKEIDDQMKALLKEAKGGDEGKTLKKKSQELDARIKILSKGTCDKRRGALEVTRAISLCPFAGDITFNAKSGEKSSTSLYGTEVHATRYQYGFALTPQSLKVPSRAKDVVDAAISLSEVGGNHSRFLYDFSPDVVIFRWTDDFAPRMLYGFEMTSDNTLTIDGIIERIELGDIDPAEMVIGISSSSVLLDKDKNGKTLADKGVTILGVKAAAAEIKNRMQESLRLKQGD